MYWNAKIETYRKIPMTYPPHNHQNLTDDEWNEMNALRKVINQNPASLHPDKMEQFTEYLVRSMKNMTEN